MVTGGNKEERKEQRKILEKMFKDYSPIHHSVFVDKYNKIIETERLDNYMRNRGIIDD